MEPKNHVFCLFIETQSNTVRTFVSGHLSSCSIVASEESFEPMAFKAQIYGVPGVGSEKRSPSPVVAMALLSVTSLNVS